MPLPSSPPSGSLRAVIAGVGGIGARHLGILRGLVPTAEIIALRHQPGSPAPNGADGVVHDLEQACVLRPDIAVLAGPAPDHVPMAFAFARCGAHLFIEKPLSDRLDGAEALLAFCREQRRLAMVGYVLRFHPTYRALKAAVDDGRVGAVRTIRAEVGQHLADWRPGRDFRQTVSAQAGLGGGAILELSHEIDCVRWLAGEVTAVTAMAGQVGGLGIDVEDVADLTLRFAGGAIGTVHVDMVRRPPARRVTVVGEAGVLELEAGLGRVSLLPANGGAAVLLTDGAPERNRMYIDQLAHFLACVRDGIPPAADMADGLAVLKIALAAKRAAADGLTVRLDSGVSPGPD